MGSMMMMAGFKTKRRLLATSDWPIITITYLYYSNPLYLQIRAEAECVVALIER